MSTLSQTDLTVRLQLIGQEYSSLCNTYVNDLKWGKKCAKTEWKKLILLSSYISLLEDYNVGEDDNCITETQLQTMLDNTSKLIKICFKPIGFSYSTTPTTRQFDDSFSDSFF